ncbi:hypothetical protein niasHT_004040 [Heterodera trifolii]|uniref:Uncharacterized protein n=1 Tax=Heterodera trifolii TaxID=157864 RepID=A0ABD2M0I9_9BILA
MPKTPKSTTPSLLGRVVRKLSSARKAHPHRFVFEPKKLLIDTDERWRPVEHIVLVFRHRHRLFRSKMRSMEDSCSVGNRRVLVWPDRVVDDPIEFVTTLYNRRKQCNELDDKEWILFVEGPMVQTTTSASNGGGAFSASGGSSGVSSSTSTATAPVARPLATAELNVRVLIGPADCVAQVHLELRPIHEGVLGCSLDLVVHCFPFDNECVSPFSHHLLASTPNSVRCPPTPSAAVVEHHHNAEDANVGDGTSIKLVAPNDDEEKGGEVSDGTGTVAESVAQQQIVGISIEPVPPNDDEENGGEVSDGTGTVAESVAQHQIVGISIEPVPPNDDEENGREVSDGTGTVAESVAQQQIVGISIEPVLPNDDEENGGEVSDGTGTVAESVAEQLKHHQEPDASTELAERLAQCVRQIVEIEQQDIFIGERMLEIAPGSAAESELISHHLRLIEEKEELSRRQDFLNTQLDLHETEQRIVQLRMKIVAEDDAGNGGGHCNGTVSALPPTSPFYAALRHQNNTALLLELKQLIDHKNDLVMRISDYEDEA